MTYRGIFEYEYPVEHKEPVGIDVYLHGDCVKGKIIEWEYKALEQEQYYKDLAESYEKTINKLTKAIAEQEPKTGEWIEQNDDYFDWYECSECGYGSEGEMQYSSEYDVRTNYCPHCGAKMEVTE